MNSLEEEVAAEDVSVNVLSAVLGLFALDFVLFFFFFLSGVVGPSPIVLDMLLLSDSGSFSELLGTPRLGDTLPSLAVTVIFEKSMTFTSAQACNHFVGSVKPFVNMSAHMFSDFSGRRAYSFVFWNLS